MASADEIKEIREQIAAELAEIPIDLWLRPRLSREMSDDGALAQVRSGYDDGWGASNDRAFLEGFLYGHMSMCLRLGLPGESFTSDEAVPEGYEGHLIQLFDPNDGSTRLSVSLKVLIDDVIEQRLDPEVGDMYAHEGLALADELEQLAKKIRAAPMQRADEEE